MGTLPSTYDIRIIRLYSIQFRKQQWYISAMAVLHNQRTHIHKERRRICGIVEQHAMAMAQQAQEPARWLSAKSCNKNRRAISHYKIAGTRARHTHLSDYKRGNKKKRRSPWRLGADVGMVEIRGSVAE